jgi:hypothetical protein
LSLLVFAADRKLRAAVFCAAGFALGIGPYLCWSRLEYDGFLETFRNGWSNLGGPAEPFFYYVKIAPNMVSWVAIAGLILLVGGRVWDSRRGLDWRRIRWEGFLWFWALAVMVFFSSISHKESRYSIPVAAPLLLLAGIGLSTLLDFRRRAARTAGGLVLAGALLFTFWPDRHRFDTGFFDPSVSEEMTVSAFLKSSLPQPTILYTNENYPDFAYYSGMTVNDLPESGDQLYESLKQLPADGILIAYKRVAGDDSVPEPPLEVLDANPHFSRLREFPSLVLYKYHCVEQTRAGGSHHCMEQTLAIRSHGRTAFPCPQVRGTRGTRLCVVRRDLRHLRIMPSLQDGGAFLRRFPRVSPVAIVMLPLQGRAEGGALVDD